MLRIVLLLALLVGTALSALGAQAPSLKILRVSQASGATLPRWGTVHFEVAYDADQPVRVQAQAFADGKSVGRGQAMNASVAHPAGKGTALASVSFSEPARIDEIRITLHDRNWRPLLVARVPLRLAWSEVPAEKSAPPPDWVLHLIAEERQIADQYGQDHPQGVGGLGLMLFALMYLSVPAYVVLQFYAPWRLTGAWRVAAVAPLALMAPVFIATTYFYAMQSNLWPLSLLFASPVACLGLLGLLWLGGPTAGRTS